MKYIDALLANRTARSWFGVVLLISGVINLYAGVMPLALLAGIIGLYFFISGWED